MKKIILFLCLFSITQGILAQNFVYVDDEIDGEEETLKISDEITFPDIRVELGRDITFEDIKVGITNQKNQAHYILAYKKSDAGRFVQVDNCDNFPDLSIEYGEHMSFPDYKIELVDNPFFADVLIYSEKMTLSEQELIACLLPLIREKADK